MTFPSRPSLHAETLALDTVALHLVRAIVRAAHEARSTNLEELAGEIGVRKADCRAALTTLHRQGYVDVLRMRPTFEGFALGAALQEAELRPARPSGVARGPELRLRDLPADLLGDMSGGPSSAERRPRDIGHVGGPRTSEPPPSSRAA